MNFQYLYQYNPDTSHICVGCRTCSVDVRCLRTSNINTRIILIHHTYVCRMWYTQCECVCLWTSIIYTRIILIHHTYVCRMWYTQCKCACLWTSIIYARMILITYRCVGFGTCRVDMGCLRTSNIYTRIILIHHIYVCRIWYMQCDCVVFKNLLNLYPYNSDTPHIWIYDVVHAVWIGVWIRFLFFINRAWRLLYR